MIDPKNPVLARMLERLFASLVNGPAMNCRPHASRQRLDFTQLAKLQDAEPAELLATLLADARKVKATARVPTPAKTDSDDDTDEQAPADPETLAARRAFADQRGVLTKLRVIADDARTYEQDTGVHVLDIGFPLLSLPPGSFGGRGGVASRRILAPIAFIPVSLTVKTGPKQTIEIACRGEGVDLVRPNVALLAWLEQQTGQSTDDLFSDDTGDDPWREIRELVKAVASRVDVARPPLFDSETLPETIALVATPRADDDETLGKSIVPAAVLGLFPATNQGLLRDTRDMLAHGAPDGPIERFVRHSGLIDSVVDADAGVPESPDTLPTLKRVFAEERLVSHADPCQARAVRLARTSRATVVHGPPGTGKSQTIANAIGDHLARGQRVLFVCDKRTALDVVADRLTSIGFGDLLATVHDPQRDQREFYRSVREQLDTLVDAKETPAAEKKLAKLDDELQSLHDELSAYHATLMGRHGGPGSFHDLIGQWLGETGGAVAGLDERKLQDITAADFEQHAVRLRETLDRGETAGYATNPWRDGVGIDLSTFLAAPMNDHSAAVAAVVTAADAADATATPYDLPFTPEHDLAVESKRRAKLAAAIKNTGDVPNEIVRHWATRSATDVATALSAVETLSADVKTIADKPLDASLQSAASTLTQADLLGIDRAALAAFATGVQSDAARLDAVGPDAIDLAVEWLQQPPAKIVAAKKRLDAAAPMADTVSATMPDASLNARVTAAPVDPQTLVTWLAALASYLDIAGSWTALFHGARKKAAAPAVAHFGLSLNADSAKKVRDFLQTVQQRDDLRATLEAATGKPFAGLPEDEELVGTFRRQRAVLAALLAPPAATASADSFARAGRLHADRSPAVAALLTQFGLPVTADAATRLAEFVSAVVLRHRVNETLAATTGVSQPTALPDDAEIAKRHRGHRAVLQMLNYAGVGSPLADGVVRILRRDEHHTESLASLEQSPVRAAAIGEFEATLSRTPLFSSVARESLSVTARSGTVAAAARPFADRLNTLEQVLRIRDVVATLPPTLATAAETLLAKPGSADDGFSTVRRNVLAGEIGRRLRDNPQLQRLDGHRLQAAFGRYRELSEDKKSLVRQHTMHLWTTRQRQRLLAATGSRLNSLGADLRRRLTLRGDKAMRLRQVIAHGKSVDGGDPLFDLRPVWMASPETVAQLFAREPIFDVIVFDEASQCRLEEALPVLTRGQRIVIAGDPKQLPPTRFFESAVAVSEDIEAETEQELFEAHQGEVEDLLTAALSVDGIEECYLNVHYRSRNSDLIGFSNEHFYGSRLQAIPGHPKHRVKYAPITLYRVDGVYEKRRNTAEAEAVCKIVHDLLRRADPPSIGIACFNLVQRELILETLEAWAEKDAAFAGKLAAARDRRGHGSSEGLFVKNLENVQGDERDHLIISTTYGPDATGKFRRSFGPLGTAGGGRRLNVLVTRARNEIHLVTSIPRSAYSSLPAVPSGSTPGGAWLLFAYLNYAEQLQAEYDTERRLGEATDAPPAASTTVRQSGTPSRFAEALGHTLASRSALSTDVHWGNDGFCVDVAVRDPKSADDVLIGVQCDLTRFAGSDDPVEWDAFQTAIHEGQGWTLHRVWSPHFFRDPDGVLKTVNDQASA